MKKQMIHAVTSITHHFVLLLILQDVMGSSSPSLEGPSSCEDGLQEAQPHKDALAQGKEKQDAEYPQARSVQAGKQPDHREIWLVPLVGPEDSSRQEKATLKVQRGNQSNKKTSVIVF